MLNTIIFDFDGVIENTFELSYKLFKEFNPWLKKEDLIEMFTGNIWNKNNNLIPNDDEFDKKYREGIKEYEIHPIMQDIIKKLSKKYTIHIISSNSQITLKQYLTDNKIFNNFNLILGHETHKSKIEKFNILLKKENLKPQNCLFITDTLGDIKEAKKVNIKTIAVTWGYHDLEILKRGNPHKIIHKYEELLSTILIEHGEKIKVLYKNWKGVEKIRTIIPKKIYFGTTKFHKEKQWLLKVEDIEKKVERIYSLKNIKEWFVN